MQKTVLRVQKYLKIVLGPVSHYHSLKIPNDRFDHYHLQPASGCSKVPTALPGQYYGTKNNKRTSRNEIWCSMAAKSVKNHYSQNWCFRRAWAVLVVVSQCWRGFWDNPIIGFNGDKPNLTNKMYSKTFHPIATHLSHFKKIQTRYPPLTPRQSLNIQLHIWRRLF